MNIFPVLSLICFVVSWTLGVAVLVRNPKDRANRAFCIFMLFLSVAAFAEFECRILLTPETASIFYDVQSTVWYFIPVLFLNFALIFCRRGRILSTRLYRPLLLFPAIVFSYLQWTTDLIYVHQGVRMPWGYSFAPGRLLWIYAVYTLVYFAVALYFIYRFSQETYPGREKKQATIIFGSVVFSLIAGIATDIFMPIAGISAPEMTSVFVTISAGCIAYAIVRYHLMHVTPATVAYNILAAIPDTVVLVDAEGKISETNQAVEQLLGYGKDELIGRRGGTLLAEEEEEEEEEALLKDKGLARVFKETVVRGQETTCISKSGERIPVRISGQVMKDARGNITGIVAVIHDLREERKLRQELIQIEKMSTVGFMAGGIAHELNNPLGVVLGYIQLFLSDTSKDDPRFRDLKIVESAVHRCKTIVQNLLSFSRQEKVVLVPVNVAQALQSTLALIGHQMEVNGIKIVQNIQNNLYSVKGDTQQLEQVFINIMVNAQDAMPHGGELTITAENIDRQVRIVFKDTGCGIPPDILSKIFEPFVTTKPPGKGTGLGLSVSYGIIKDHGGNIDIQSKEGVGTTVIITLHALNQTSDSGQ